MKSRKSTLFYLAITYTTVLLVSSCVYLFQGSPTIEKAEYVGVSSCKIAVTGDWSKNSIGEGFIFYSKKDGYLYYYTGVKRHLLVFDPTILNWFTFTVSPAWRPDDEISVYSTNANIVGAAEFAVPVNPQEPHRP